MAETAVESLASKPRDGSECQSELACFLPPGLAEPGGAATLLPVIGQLSAQGFAWEGAWLTTAPPRDESPWPGSNEENFD